MKKSKEKDEEIDELIYYQKGLKYTETEEIQSLKSCEGHDLNQDSSFHPNDATLSHLARVVYKQKISEELNANNLTDWKLISYGSHTDKYFGAAFYNRKTNQLVISHQGTNCFKDFLTDAQGVVRRQLTSQIRSACTFCAIVLNKLDSKKVHVSFTGHSLGAWLAQITTFTCEYLHLNEQNAFEQNSTNRNYNIHTVAFDSPGCYEMLSSISNFYFLKYENEADYLITDLDITIYFNMPNLINSVNSHRHISRLLQIYKDDEEIQYSSWRDTSTHKMKRFVDMLRSENSKILTVLDWPSFSVPEKTNKKTRKGPSSYLLSTEVIKLAGYLTKKFFFAENELKSCINKFNECSKKGKFDFTLEMNDKKISYKAENYDKNTQRVSAFSFNELNFLRFWEKFEKSNLTKEKFHERFQNISLPKFEITKENEKEIIKCSRKEDMEIIVNYVKNLYCNEPEIHEIVKTESEKIPELYRSYYEFYSKNYIEKFPEYKNVNFTDTIELREFLDSDKKIFCLMTKQNTMNEIFRIQKLLAIYEKSEQCYFNLVELNELKRHTNVSKIFQNKEITIDKYLIIDCSAQENANTDILKELINDSQICQNNKKLILVSNKNLRGYDTSKWANRNKISFELKDFDEESKQKLLNTQIEISSFENKKLNLLEFFGQTVNDFFEKQKYVIEYLLKKELKIPELCSENIVNFDAVKIRILKVYEDIKNEKFKQFFEQTINDRIFYAISGGSGNNLKERSGLEMNVNAVEINGDPENFYEYCREINETSKNIDKFKIYWLHLPTDPDLIEIREVFVSDLYINRSFYPQILIQSELFEKVSPSSQFVSAEERLIEELEKVMQKKQTPFEFTLKVKGSSEAPSNNVCTINDKWVADFNTKFEFANGHIIKVEKISQNYKFIWKSSSSPVHEIRNLTITDYFVEQTESQLMKNDNDLVIIADKPGMGKSTTLLYIATNMKNKWIIWISLISIREKIPTPNPNIENIVKFLQIANNNLTNPLIESMLRYSLNKKSSVPIVFFFDGFDEIENETARQNMIKIFKYIKNKTNAKLWITTRYWAKRDLENELSTFTIKMKEMTDEEQLSLITNIWESRLVSLKENRAQLKSFAKMVLSEVETVLVFDRTISKNEQNYYKKEVDEILKHYKNCSDDKKFKEILDGIQIDFAFYYPKYYCETRMLFVNKYLKMKKEGTDDSLINHFLTFQDEYCKKLKDLMKDNNQYYNFIYEKLKDFYEMKGNDQYYNFIGKKVKDLNEMKDNDQYYNFIGKIVKDFNEMKDNDQYYNFIGIPMQLRIIADMVQPEEDDLGELIKNFYNLYKKFILKKIKIYYREKLGRKDDLVYEQALINKHERLGFQLLFSEEAEHLLDSDEILEAENDENSQEIELLNNIGLVQSESQNKLRFVHYSFAEYCAAAKIFKLLKKLGKNIWTCEYLEKFIEEKILIQKEYNTIRRFLNDVLQETDTSYFQFLKQKKKVYGSPDHTPLHIAVEENNETLAKILLESYEFKINDDDDDDDDDDDNDNDNNSNQTQIGLGSLLYKAVQNKSSYELIKKITEVKPRQGFWKIEHKDYLNFDMYVVFFPSLGEKAFKLMIISIQKDHKTDMIIIEEKIDEIVKEGELLFNGENDQETKLNFKRLLKEAMLNAPKIFDIIIGKERNLNLYRELIHGNNDWSLKLLHDLIVHGFKKLPFRSEYQIAKDLINSGLNVNMFLKLLRAAVDKGAWDIAELIIDRFDDQSLSTVNGGIAKIIKAAKKDNKISIISKLLEKGASAIDIKDELNLTKIGFAVLSNDIEKVQKLIKNPWIKLNLTARCARSDREDRMIRYDLLQVAVINNRLEMTKELLSNEQIKKDIDNSFYDPNCGRILTPLQSAIYNGFKEVANTLLDRGADVKIAVKNSGYTALHAAAEAGDAEMVKKLIEKNSEINAKAKVGQNTELTPILLAAYLDKWDIVKILIDNGADPSGEIITDAFTGEISEYLFRKKIETVKSLAEAAGRTEILDRLLSLDPYMDIKYLFSQSQP